MGILDSVVGMYGDKTSGAPSSNVLVKQISEISRAALPEAG